MMSSVLSELFQTVLSLSIVGSYVILLVLLVRLVLCKAPKWCSYVLWGLVFLRLTCPVFPEAQFSLIPSQLSSVGIIEGVNNEKAENANWEVSDRATGDVGEQSANALTGNAGVVADGHSTVQNKTENVLLQNQEQLMQQGVASSQAQLHQQGTASQEANSHFQGTANTQTLYIVSVLWLSGALLLAGYHTFSYWYLKRKVRGAVTVEPCVKEIPGEHLSFVMGIFNPVIYLSEGLDEESRRVVLCHERVHLQRRDYLTKPLALAISCVHWFNPLVWLAFYLMNKDCEMSCDEKVVSLLGEESKKIYSYALLDEATKGERKYYRKKTVCALLSFGEDNVKSRISHVLHYKKASLWIIVCAVIAMVVLIVGLCCNPGRKSITLDEAWELIVEKGGYTQYEDATVWYEIDYENDNKKEFFAEIGEEQPDTDQLKGDLWFVSEEGEATLLLEDKSFYRWESFVYRGKEFPLFSYKEEDGLKTAMFEVWENEAHVLFSEQEEKYVDGENLVCFYPDTQLQYDIREKTFSGYDEKKYSYYYDGRNFLTYHNYEITREEVEDYKNGAEVLKALEETYPKAHFEYRASEDDLLYINVARREQDIIYFSYSIYEVTDGRLTLLEEGPGCYKSAIAPAGGTTFVQQIAKEYGWQTDNEMVTSQITARSALERFAWAFADRDGNALYQLSHDKENFENWDMVIPLADGGYAFGASSPWAEPGEYLVTYTNGDEEVPIRFIMSNSAPEKYVAIEKVQVTKEGELYFVDHKAFKMYDEIQTRAELEEIFNLEAAAPFESAKTGYYESFPRIILQHILNKTNPEYYSAYTDPITSAKKLLHLGEGSGEVTEMLYGVLPQQPLNSGYGEGSVVNVRYTFAKDASTVDIPMVLADESESIWVLYSGDVTQLEAQTAGSSFNTGARIVYEEYNADGSYVIGTPTTSTTYQFSNYGVYRLDAQGLKCIYPRNIRQDDARTVAFYEGKIYFPTDSQYYEGALDWMYDSVCVLNPETGEYTYLPLSTSAQGAFPLNYFYINSGYLYLDDYVMMLADTEPVWEGKYITELSEAERNTLGIVNRKNILENPNTVIAVGNSTDKKTLAFIDMDGDGATEEISIEQNPEGNYMYHPMDDYILRCGEGFEYRNANNLENEIYAFSPDGERIFIALYEDGPSADPLSTIFKYEYNRLQKAGEFDNDITSAHMENGIINTYSRNWVMQTDSIAVQYFLNDKGDMEQISQEIYYYGVHHFMEDMNIQLQVAFPVHKEPEGQEKFTIEPQKVSFVAVHHSMNWVLVEAADGKQGWVHVEDGEIVDLKMNTMEVFYGLNMAG